MRRDCCSRRGNRIQTAQVDADHVEELTGLMRSFKPDIVINVALPYQDLTIMEACLEAGVNYLDTANYEPKDEAHFEYSWQWAYHERFKEKRIDRYFWDVDSIRAYRRSLPLMLPNITSMKFNIWIS